MDVTAFSKSIASPLATNPVKLEYRLLPIPVSVNHLISCAILILDFSRLCFIVFRKRLSGTNLQIVLQGISLVNKGDFLQTAGTVKFTGVTNNSVSGCGQNNNNGPLAGGTYFKKNRFIKIDVVRISPIYSINSI